MNTTNDSAIGPRLISQLKKRFGRDDITEDTSFVEDLNADSLDFVEAVIGAEEEFGVSIPDDDAEKIKTVGDMVRYLEEKSAEKAGA